MAFGVTFIGHAPGAGAATMALPAYNQTSGHCIVVGIQVYPFSGTFGNITDTAGNNANYVQAITKANGTITGYLYYVKNCLGNATNVITVHAGAGVFTFAGMFAWDISGASLTTPLDQTASGSGTGTSPLTAPFTTQFANEVIIGYNISNPSTASAANGGATLDGNEGQGANLSSGSHLLVSSIQTNTTAGFTALTSTWEMMAATFTDGVSSGGGNNNAGLLRLLGVN